MTDIIVITVLALVIGGAVAYIVKSKKKGGCIGCPNGGNCSACSSCILCKRTREH